MQAKLGLWPLLLLSEAQTVYLQIFKGISPAVATSSHDPDFLSGLLLSEHHTQLQLPGGQKERAV